MTATRYLPLDIDYPTNYPGSNNIPLPSGLLKDLGINPLLVLESNIKGTRQGWCWTMARTQRTAPASTLVAPLGLNQFTGYRNPTTIAALYDRSTVGLQISGQIANNFSLEPVTIAVPFSFSSSRKKSIRVGITGQIYAYLASHAGMGISVGFIGWDSNGTFFQRLPYDWSGACDLTQPNPDEIIFNRNPDLPTGPDIKYFDPVDSTVAQMRYFELEIPYRGEENWPEGGQGFVLISMVSWPGDTTVPGGAGKGRTADWDWLIYNNIVDPNHLILKKVGFRYEDYFSFSTGSTKPETGAKHVRIGAGEQPISFMFKISAGDFVPQNIRRFSYHSMMQFRMEGDAGKGYDHRQATTMIYPFIPRNFISDTSTYDLNNWQLDVFPMSSATISSIFIDEIPFDEAGNNLYTSDIDDYYAPETGTGSINSAGVYQDFINSPITTLAKSGYGAANCNSRVKGTNTVGVLTGVQVLEKNEAFPWNYYDPAITYGGKPVGTYFSINYSTVNFEGWNQGEGYIWAESTTPPKRVVTSDDPVYRIDCLLFGDDQARELEIDYPLSIGRSGSRYNPSLDRTINTIPFDPSNAADTAAQGVPSALYTKGGSFNTPGMLDRYWNNNIPQDYRLLISYYPIAEAVATDFQRASGFTNNYMTAGAVSFNTILLVWDEEQPLANISFYNEAYGPFEIKERGNLEIFQPVGVDPGILSIEPGTIFVTYGATYTSIFTRDPS
jgi:hypothetical protein